MKESATPDKDQDCGLMGGRRARVEGPVVRYRAFVVLMLLSLYGCTWYLTANTAYMTYLFRMFFGISILGCVVVVLRTEAMVLMRRIEGVRGTGSLILILIWLVVSATLATSTIELRSFGIASVVSAIVSLVAWVVLARPVVRTVRRA